jgi:hypothetical protein
MAMAQGETEALYDRLAEAIDRARNLGEPDEMEVLLLAKLAFVALRELGDISRADELIAMALKDLDRPDS